MGAARSHVVVVRPSALINEMQRNEDEKRGNLSDIVKVVGCNAILSAAVDEDVELIFPPLPT